MKKGGLADSPFFHLPQREAKEASTPSPQQSSTEATAAASSTDRVARLPATPTKRKRATPDNPEKTATQRDENNVKPQRHRDTTIPRHHDTTVSRYHEAIIELVRRAVKEFGKEAATHRFTLEEKKAIADLIYTYKNRGIRTSENEVTRIAVNFIVNDFRENGEESVLNRVLKALNS